MTGISVEGTRLRQLASVLLVVGAALGMAGSFAPSAELRGPWGVDGVALIVAAICLCIWHLRQGDQLLASGFLVFAPLPFFAYPVFAATLVGWAWVHLRGGEPLGLYQPKP